MSFSCDYRIYPTWFVEADPTRPMRELADRTAARMGRQVEDITLIDSGFDRRGGWFMDFRVTYSSTTSMPVGAAS